MAEARSRGQWARASALMALIANCHRDPKKSRSFKPADFDPYLARKADRLVVDKENIGLLKHAFLDKGAKL
jgi:hypothetical protein